MDQLMFHPRIVHLPIALSVLMPLVAGGVTFAYFRGWFDRRVWVIVLLLQTALVATALSAMYTGDMEEERVEQVVPERHIEAHEAAATRFVWASAVVLILMAAPFVLAEGDLSNALMIFSCVGAAVVLALGYRTGEAGGRLVYEHGAASVHVERAATSPDNRIPALDEYEDDADTDE